MFTVCDSNGNVLSCLALPWLDVSVGMAYCNADHDADSISVYSGGTYSGSLNSGGYEEDGTFSGGTEISQSYISGSMGNQSGPGGQGGPGGRR